MHIFTDDPHFANSFLKKKLTWNKTKSLEHNGLESLSKALIPNGMVYFSSSNLDAGWSHLFLIKYSKFSQFEVLKELAGKNDNLPDRILCAAGSGGNFKGYRNRTWISLPGNIHLCAFLKPDKPVKQFHVGFTILSAVSVLQTLQQIEDLKAVPKIKWVNDILIKDKKIAGVLTHTQTLGNNVTAVILGIGLNVEQSPQLPQNLFIKQATSVMAFSEKKNSHLLTQIFEFLIRKIEQNYKILCSGDYQNLLNIYRANSVIMNKNVQIYSDPINELSKITKEGIVESIGDNLELYLRGVKEPVHRGKVIYDI